jgi:hypothetical protein
MNQETRNKYNNFKRDLPYGLEGEDFLRVIAKGYLTLGEDVIQVKTEQLFKNVFVETESRGKPSGIRIPTAPMWCFLLDGVYKRDVLVIIRRERLIKLLAELDQRGEAKEKAGGDNMTSRGYSIPVETLLRRLSTDKM